MTAAPITYGLHADAYLVAHALDVALQGHGWHVSVDELDDHDEVFIVRRGAPMTTAVPFMPGQQLTVAADGSWKIVPAPELAPGPIKRTPEEWCAQYGVDIIDPDGWRSKDAPAWDEPITLADFYDRAIRCTIRSVICVDWTRIVRDAKAAAA